MPQLQILHFDGVEELDAMGPWEVLSAWTQQCPEDGWSARLVDRLAGTPRARQVRRAIQYDPLPPV